MRAGFLYSSYMLGTVVFAVLLGCQKPTSASAASPNRDLLGANLEGIADWSRSMAFADIMKQSREFGQPDKPWVAIKTLDAQGWPTTDFGVILMASQKGVANTGGTYKLSFECKGNPSIRAVASGGTIQNLHREGGLWKADLDAPQGQDSLMLGFTNTDGGVRNLHVLRPLPAEGQFTKVFVDHIRRFGTLRFMDWGSTNGNKQEKWSQRNLPESPSYANDRGVPYEAMIDLANLVHADPWFCVPEHADDDYVRNLAELCKKRLDPKLHVYVENSNEVWNWGFEQSHYNLDHAKAEGPDAKDLSWDGKGQDWTWPARRIAKRLMQIRAIFKDVYGARFSDSVRPILAGQVVWPENWLEQGLNYIDHNYGPPKDYIYAIAGAPYFNLGKANDEKDLTKDQVLDAMSKVVDAIPTYCKADWYATNLKKYGLRLVAYEAGPDTFGPNSIQGKKEAQFDPRMRQILLKYYRTWRSMGGGLMNYFVAGATGYDGQYGTWGLTDDLTKTSPKIQAIDDILAGRWRE